MKNNRNRKAVSPVIATLLMIAVAVAASVVMYSWVNTMVKTQATQSQTAIRIDQVQFYNYQDTMQISVSIRNTGTTGAVIQTMYIYRADAQIAKLDKVNIAIPAGVLSSFGFTTAQSVGGVPQWYADPVDAANQIILPEGELRTSAAYLIRLVTDNGFSVEGTYYTPNNFPGALHHYTFTTQPGVYNITGHTWATFAIEARDYYEKLVINYAGTPTVTIIPSSGASIAQTAGWAFADGKYAYPVNTTLVPEPAAGTGYTITLTSSLALGSRTGTSSTFSVVP